MKAHADGIDVLKRGDADPSCIMVAKGRCRSRVRVFYPGRLKAHGWGFSSPLRSAAGRRPASGVCG